MKECLRTHCLVENFAFAPLETTPHLIVKSHTEGAPETLNDERQSLNLYDPPLRASAKLSVQKTPPIY
ncbi:hypothetical protein GCM10011391_05270 [Pullulanibacillus camelliae]|uniref:Uncharacterized protein n=1 Tax=Pullulanibacillus camelliae TaxID=1707096 RepID=A0A8J2VLC1_9BACL|nr:hypothetical protein GCM10011391_05270 [Pullulanibacillus camelliae]